MHNGGIWDASVCTILLYHHLALLPLPMELNIHDINKIYHIMRLATLSPLPMPEGLSWHASAPRGDLFVSKHPDKISESFVCPTSYDYPSMVARPPWGGH